jgi:NADPH:quinone reductase-like Zn-dependent oxidoreductase
MALPPTMLAARHDRHGPPDVLTVREVPLPKLGARQWLVRVEAAALNPKDVVLRSGRMRPLDGFGPYAVAFDWAGTLVARGARAPELALGTRLFGMLDGFRGGACAQYVVTGSSGCAEVPRALDLEQASALPLVSLTALQALRDVARVRAGQRVLINGAAGGVGSVAVQIAKVLGADVHATASPHNHALLRSLGAREASDYRELSQTLQRERFDVVFDAFGALSLSEVRPGLKERGTLVTTLPKLKHVLRIVLSVASRQRMRMVVVRPRRADLEYLAALAERGQLVPVIDRVVPLAEVADAYRHLATKHARGKIVLRIP